MNTMDIIYTNTQDRGNSVVTLESGANLGDLLEKQGICIDEVNVNINGDPVSDPEWALRDRDKVGISQTGVKGAL